MSRERSHHEPPADAVRTTGDDAHFLSRAADLLTGMHAPGALLCSEGRMLAANEAFAAAHPKAAQTGCPFADCLPVEPQRAAFLVALGRMMTERVPHSRMDALVGGRNGDAPVASSLLLSRFRLPAETEELFLLQCLPGDSPESPAGIQPDLLKMALHAAGLGVWQYEPARDALRFSQSGAALVAPEGGGGPITGSLQDFLDLVAPEYRELVGAEIKRCARAGGGDAMLDVAFPLADGPSECWLALRGRGFARSKDHPCDLLAGIIEDTTGTKLTEQALRKSDDIFRQLTENVDGVFWMRSHEDNSLLYVSPGFDKIWGCEANEMLADPSMLTGSVHPGDLERVREATAADAASRDPFHYHVEYRIVRPDGEVRWVSDHAFPIFSGDGRIHRRAGLLTDITERKASEERLTLLGTALDAAANSVVITDKDGVIRWVNPAFLAVTGYQEHEVVGKPTGILKSGVHDRAYYDSLWETIRSGRVWRGEISNKRKDGSTYQEDMTITPVRGTDGRIDHYIAIKQDITERLAASQALTASERKYRSLFEAAHEAILLLNDGEILDCNKHAETLFECARRHIIGGKLYDFAPIRQPDGADSADKVAEIERRAAGRGISEWEWKGKRWNGLLFDGELSASSVRFGSETWVQVILRDVSERRRMETRMRQNQKLEAIGQLAGGVAHDFNNLLLVITGHLELMLETMGAHERGRPHVEKARTAALHAADLTKQLLAFSRQQVMVSKRVNLTEITRESLSLLGRLIPHNISIRERLAPDACCIRADPGQMRQIIMNLVVNARDAMPDGGTIHVGTGLLNIARPVEIPSNIDRLQVGDYVVLTIEDTGHGMDADTVARIFDPFFTTKEKGRGTGLGLATVFGIVKQSGGDIAVESQPGKGTTFTLYFPRMQEDGGDEAEPRATGAAEASPGAETKTGIVFVVEDESTVRSLVSQILIGAGYKVLTAETPGEALRLAANRDFTPDLLIADVMLPGMSGPELSEALRERWPTLRVLYTSGYSDIGVLGPGCSFIQKPYGSSTLLQKVRALIDGGGADDAGDIRRDAPPSGR